MNKKNPSIITIVICLIAQSIVVHLSAANTTGKAQVKPANLKPAAIAQKAPFAASKRRTGSQKRVGAGSVRLAIVHEDAQYEDAETDKSADMGLLQELIVQDARANLPGSAAHRARQGQSYHARYPARKVRYAVARTAMTGKSLPASTVVNVSASGLVVISDASSESFNLAHAAKPLASSRMSLLINAQEKKIDRERQKRIDEEKERTKANQTKLESLLDGDPLDLGPSLDQAKPELKGLRA